MDTRALVAVALVLSSLFACGGSDGNPPPGGGSGVTVNGQLFDAFEQPLANVTVLSGSQSTTTNASGNFTLTNVTSPYDLTLVAPAPAKVAVVLKGLTRTDPKIHDLGYGLTTGTVPNAGVVQGSITGGVPVSGTGDTDTAVAFSSPQAPSGPSGTFIQSSPYALNVRWAGPTQITGTLYALQTTYDSNNYPSAYNFGTRPGVSVGNGGTTTGADLTLSAATTQTIAGTVTIPLGYALEEKDVEIDFANLAFVPVVADTGSDAGFSYLVPSGVGATASVRVSASQGDVMTETLVSQLAPGTSSIPVVLQPASVPIAPPAGATAVTTSTDFSWSAFAGGVHTFFAVAGASDPRYVVVTAGTTTRLPSLTGQGLSLPSGRSYQWGVSGIAPFATVDALIGSGPQVLPPVLSDSIARSNFTTQ